LLGLVDELNVVSRWTALSLPSAPNAWGTAAALAAATGYGRAVSFVDQSPLHDADEFSAPILLRDGAVDALLAIGSPPGEDRPAYLGSVPEGMPAIVVEAQESAWGARAAVRLPVAAPGVAAPGTMARLDRVALPLRALVASPWPADAVLLHRLVEEVRARGL
jgi:formylmethanofuran dehydrogenase subunit B